MCNEFHSISIYVVLEAATVYLLVRHVEESRAVSDLIAAGLCMGGVMLFRGEAVALVWSAVNLILYLAHPVRV